MPGAVPSGFGTTRLPRGNCACSLLRSGISRLPAGEQLRICCERSGIFNELDTGRRGDGVARQVVGGGPQAAGADDNVCPVDRRAEHRDVGLQVVGDGRVEQHGDAELAEPLAEPLAIGIRAAGRWLVRRQSR